MAIIDKFEASICVDGQPLVEYDFDDNEQDLVNRDLPPKSCIEVRKYVEARANTNFEVRTAIRSGYVFPGAADHLGFKVILDGVKQHEPVGTRSSYERAGRYLRISDGHSYLKGSVWYIKKFRFNNIALVEDINNTVSTKYKGDFNLIGTIVVEVWPYKTRADPCNKERAAKTIGQVSEKALKGRAVTLAAGLDEEQPTTDKNHVYGDNLSDTPLTRFVFEYRTIECLQQLSVIPRPRSPTPLEDRDPDTLTVEESRTLIRTLKARERMKLEALEIIKQEESTIRNKRKRSDTLTDDDDSSDGEIQEVKRPSTAKTPIEVIELD